MITLVSSLDPDYESVGRKFESCRARHKNQGGALIENPFLFLAIISSQYVHD